jgi:hypothetical protein
MVGRNALITIVVVALTSLLAVSAMSQQKRAAPPSTPTATRPTEREGESQIEMFVRYSMPGKEHKLLQRMAGRWETVSKYWKEPGEPPVEAKGSAKRKLVLDGRFIMEELDGGVLGMPFRGVGLYGYDAFEKKYTSAWLDTTSTAICTYLGVYDEKKDLVDFVGEYGDPWTGVKMKIRGVTRFLGEDKHALELYMPTDKGGERKLLEIVYTRAQPKPKRETTTSAPAVVPARQPHENE